MISKLKPNISEDATQQYKQNNDNDEQKVAKNINLHNTPTIFFQKLDGGVCPKVAKGKRRSISGVDGRTIIENDTKEDKHE